MMTQLACPHCSRPLPPSELSASEQPACPDCGETLARPSPAFVTAPAVDDVQPEDDFEDEGPLRLGGWRAPADQGEMDMTPMVDVTFLLLIFFIMTAAFALQKAIEIPPTEEETAQKQTLEDFEEDQDYVVVRVDADNVFWVSSPASDKEQEAPSEVELLAQLRAARGPAAGGRGPSKMLVLASGDARHEFVVKALDAGTAVGMEEVKLSTMDEL